MDNPKAGKNTALSGWLLHPPQNFPGHFLHLFLHLRLYHQSLQGLGYVTRVIGGDIALDVELEAHPSMAAYPHHARRLLALRTGIPPKSTAR